MTYNELLALAKVNFWNRMKFDSVDTCMDFVGDEVQFMSPMELKKALSTMSIDSLEIAAYWKERNAVTGFELPLGKQFISWKIKKAFKKYYDEINQLVLDGHLKWTRQEE